MALELKTEVDLARVTDADLVADGDTDTVYVIRHLTTHKHREIVRKNTIKKQNQRTHQRDEVVNWENVSDDLLTYALVNWEGVTQNGAPLPISATVTITDPDTQEERQVNARFLLDGPRKSAILERSGMNEVAAAPERRAESFRDPSGDR